MSDHVLIEQRSTTLVITLNRPERRNAVDRAMSEAVAAALDALDSRSDLRVGVITGAGGSFCSGMDLKAFVAGNRPEIEGRGFGGLTEAPPAKPLIAAVEGYALAGGCEMALACDLIVAADDASFGLPEVTRGLVAGSGGLTRLLRRIPPSLAMEYVLTGKRMHAVEAYRLGLVNRLTTSGGALAGALALADEIAANAPLATVASKRIMIESADWTAAEQWDRQRPLVDEILATRDAHEGALAFAEKRKPQWRGE